MSESNANTNKKEVETDVTKLKGWARIKNQRIPHLLITPTFRCAMICYATLAAVLFLFGIISLLKANQNSDYKIQYNETCKDKSLCQIEFTMPVTLNKPKIYYELNNFYANHRNFVKSRSYSQLRGNVLEES